MQQVVVKVWNADVAEDNARSALNNEIVQYEGCVDRHVTAVVDRGIRDNLMREEIATASQLALASDEPASAIFKAANVICADQREAIAEAATRQGANVAEAMDNIEKRGEEAATASVITARIKPKAAGAESTPPQEQVDTH